MKSDTRKIIIGAFRQLMRAVIRLALRNGVSCDEFSGLCKELYVEVAEKEYGIDGRATNLSRIALMTGISRREVKRLVSQSSDSGQKREVHGSHRIANILTAWYDDPRYLNGAGDPIDIPMIGDHPSFTALVQSVSVGGDIVPVTVLRELKRSQIVEETPSGYLRVLRRYFVPKYNTDSDGAPAMVNPNKITLACSMLVDHINTLFHNLYRKAGNQTRLELRASMQAIKADDIPAFYEFTNQRSRQLLEDVDGWLEQHYCPEAGNAVNTERLGVGVYVIQGENTSENIPIKG